MFQVKGKMTATIIECS